MTRLFGNHGTAPMVERILDETIDLDTLSLDEHVKEWLITMRQNPEEAKKRIRGKITPERYAAAFKMVDEFASSSPEGLHYTLWKAIAEVQDLCEYFSIMMSLPFMYGFSNKRWEQVINCMLEKRQGCARFTLCVSLDCSKQTLIQPSKYCLHRN